MTAKALSRALLFIILLICTTGKLAAFTLGSFSLGATVGGAAVISEAAGFGPKSQLGVSASLTAAFPFFEDAIGPGVSIFTTNVWPSDLGGGFGYRGYSDMGLSAFVLGQWVIASLSGVGDFRLGGTAGMSGSIATYQYSTLVFFVPSVDATVFLAWTPSAAPEWDFTLSLPARLLLRKDLSYSYSLGLLLGAAWVPGGHPKRQEDSQ